MVWLNDGLIASRIDGLAGWLLIHLLMDTLADSSIASFGQSLIDSLFVWLVDSLLDSSMDTLIDVFIHSLKH